MKSFCYPAVLVFLLVIVPCPVFAGIIANSTFDVDKDGWTAKELGGANNTVTYHNTGGNPGGYVSALDILDSRFWYWIAPGKFLGNVSSAYGGSLSFDLRETAGRTSDSMDGDVRLIGGGITLVFDTASDPTSNWTSYSVSFRETAPGWHLNTKAGAAPTQAQFQTVLSSLTSLSIRGEFINGSDTGDLDNVVLASPAGVPAPSSFVLLGLGVSGLVVWRGARRKRRAWQKSAR